MTDNLQRQETTPVIFIEDTMGTATRNGNNVAWMCNCGYRLPLLWSNLWKTKPVRCLGCDSEYMGISKSGEGIEEIQQTKKGNTK